MSPSSGPHGTLGAGLSRSSVTRCFLKTKCTTDWGTPRHWAPQWEAEGGILGKKCQPPQSWKQQDGRLTRKVNNSVHGCTGRHWSVNQVWVLQTEPGGQWARIGATKSYPLAAGESPCGSHGRAKVGQVRQRLLAAQVAEAGKAEVPVARGGLGWPQHPKAGGRATMQGWWMEQKQETRETPSLQETVQQQGHKGALPGETPR